MLQLLPTLLKLNSPPSTSSLPSPSPSPSNPSPLLAPRCVIAFLDFRKAYDTVNRSFLLSLMRSFGLGEGLIKWFSTLLSGTFTAASVNGHLSKLLELMGGIRQGGNESCSGYLFIPWGLDCWLTKCLSVGIKATADGEEVRGWYYADDGHIVLKSLDPDVIAAFKDAMEVFALATNQHLNLDKTKLLPIGDWPAGSVDTSARIHGLEVVSEVTSLGVTFSNDVDPPSPNWPEHVSKLEVKCMQTSNLCLSAFGRSFAAGTYGTSPFLHALEFSDPAPKDVASHLDSVLKKLVDLNLAPAKKTPSQARQRRHASPDDVDDGGLRNPKMPGIHSLALYGSPAEGSFGLLPLEEHTRARWLMQARRFILWSLDQGTVAFSPKPVAALRRRIEAAHKAGKEYDFTLEERLLDKIQPSKPIWIDIASSILTKISPAHPVDTLLSSCQHSIDQASKGKLGPIRIPPGPLRRWSIALAALGPPAASPIDLITSNLRRLHPSTSPHRSTVLAHEVHLKFWRGVKSSVCLKDATVKRVTRVLLAPKLQWQQDRRLQAVSHALPNSLSPATELEGLMKRLTKLWRVSECPNAWKEVAWRLQVNGVRAAGGHDISLPCACGWRPPAEADKVVRALSCKAHAFGSCGVAQAVLNTLRVSLPASLSSLLQPADVWLLRLPPDAQPNAINEDAWSLTCALALHSMERGHAYLYAQRRLADVVTRASNRAVGWLSYLLSDVTSSGSIPKSWKDLPSNQPFFRCITTPRDSPLPPLRHLAVKMPAALEVFPADL